MLKNLSKLECKINERDYQFLCDMDAPLGDIKEAIFQFQKYVGVVEDAIKKKQAEEATKKEEEKVVPIEEKTE